MSFDRMEWGDIGNAVDAELAGLRQAANKSLSGALHNQEAARQVGRITALADALRKSADRLEAEAKRHLLGEKGDSFDEIFEFARRITTALQPCLQRVKVGPFNKDMAIFRTGSRHICPDHVSSNSDYDIMVCVDPKKWKTAVSELISHGFESASTESPLSKEIRPDGADNKTDFREFISVKNADKDGRVLNLILTCNTRFFELMFGATEVCRRHQINTRAARIELFQILVHNNLESIWEAAPVPEPVGLFSQLSGSMIQ